MKTIAFALILIACFGCNVDLEQIPDAESVFVTTFQRSVPADVSGVRGSGDSFSSTTCYLQFTTSKKTLNSLIGPTFTPVPKANLTQAWIRENTSGKTPTWWTPRLTATTTISTSTAFHPTHTSGSAMVIFDAKTETAFMYWNGSD